MLRVEKVLEVAKAAQQKDCDSIFAVVGAERVGKSTFALCCDEYLGARPECICVDKNKLGETFTALKKYDVFHFDEAADGLYSKEGMNKFNRELEKLFMICGQENWIVFILIPDFFLLAPMFRKRRIIGLFHVYARGRVKFFDRSGIKKINFYHERYRTSDIRGRPLFSDTFPKYKGGLLKVYLEKKADKVKQQLGSFAENTKARPVNEPTKKERAVELLNKGWKTSEIAKELKMYPADVSHIKSKIGGVV